MPTRHPDSPLMNPLFAQRWSPRAFAPEPVTDAEISAIFEAARWTPSWLNNQPWLFVYDTDGALRQPILDAFMDFNRTWASEAPLVGLILARTSLDGFMGRTRDFDTGAAAMAMTLQATLLGLSVHLLGGIDLDAAYAATGADRDSTEILAGFVIGRRGDASTLAEGLQEKETPSDRKPVEAFAFKSALPSDY